MEHRSDMGWRRSHAPIHTISLQQPSLLPTPSLLHELPSTSPQAHHQNLYNASHHREHEGQGRTGYVAGGQSIDLKGDRIGGGGGGGKGGEEGERGRGARREGRGQEEEEEEFGRQILLSDEGRFIESGFKDVSVSTVTEGSVVREDIDRVPLSSEYDGSGISFFMRSTGNIRQPFSLALCLSAQATHVSQSRRSLKSPPEQQCISQVFAHYICMDST
ncbi:hypothetical protein E2C01_036895 [Portunus trituberculatus]|uniref:Uncharacterized protein n=1 Tax=Portunus trituberculatus TaxID=210409 RepID=A0A5B7FDP6_PORTR|nr:hypothetical protein [Portunus trituberculatus]